MIDPFRRRRPWFCRIPVFCVFIIIGGALLSSCRLNELAARVGPPAASRRELGAASPARSAAKAASLTARPTPDPRGPNPERRVLSPEPRTPASSNPRLPTFASSDPLARRIQAVVEDGLERGVTKRIGVAVYDMATGEATGLNAYQEFRPASVIKLAVMVAAYHAREHLDARQFNRLRPDLKRMITISDNPSTRRLVLRLGARSINGTMRELGLDQFRVGESGSQEWVLRGSKAAPADAALLLARIARRQVVGREACNEMLALLGAQERRARIPAGLPRAPDLWVGNKTGTLSGVVNDAGIILEPSHGIAYTLAIFTSGTRSEAAGNQLLSDLSAVVYGYMVARHRPGGGQAMAAGAAGAAGTNRPAGP